MTVCLLMRSSDEEPAGSPSQAKAEPGPQRKAPDTQLKTRWLQTHKEPNNCPRKRRMTGLGGAHCAAFAWGGQGRSHPPGSLPNLSLLMPTPTGPRVPVEARTTDPPTDHTPEKSTCSSTLKIMVTDVDQRKSMGEQLRELSSLRSQTLDSILKV